MTLRRTGTALTLLLLTGAALRAGATIDDKVEGDLKKIQGKWSAPSGNDDAKVKYTIDGKKLKVVAPSRTYEMTLTLDVSDFDQCLLADDARAAQQRPGNGDFVVARELPN